VFGRKQSESPYIDPAERQDLICAAKLVARMELDRKNNMGAKRRFR